MRKSENWNSERSDKKNIWNLTGEIEKERDKKSDTLQWEGGKREASDVKNISIGGKIECWWRTNFLHCLAKKKTEQKQRKKKSTHSEYRTRASDNSCEMIEIEMKMT